MAKGLYLATGPIAATVPAKAETACDLCGRAVRRPLRATVGGEPCQFCCAGCRRVYEVIEKKGLHHLLTGQGVSDQPAVTGPTEDATLDLGGLWCASCAWLIGEVLARQEGVIEADVDFVGQRAAVRYAPALTSPTLLADAVRELGYRARPPGVIEPADTARSEHRELLIRLGTAAFLALNVMMFSAAVYAGYFIEVPTAVRTNFAWLLWALATPVVFFAGWPILSRAARAARVGAVTMDTLVALGVLAAYGYSVYATLTGAREVYFDAAAMITTLVLLGRYGEAVARGRSTQAVGNLLRLAAKEAHVLRDGDETTVPVEAVAVGERVVVRPGERIPLDGRVVAGRSHVNAAMLTGEAQPVAVEAGDEVVGGTINAGGLLTVEVTHTGDDTVLAQIVAVVQRAQTDKAPVQRLVDRVAGLFVWGVLLVAGLTFAVWLWQGAPVIEALLPAIAVLVIACPCALGLATPTAIVLALGRAAELGVLVKSGEALERLAAVDMVVMDKTGTITVGRPSVTDVVAMTNDKSQMTKEELLRLAASVEQGSEHPLGRAIVAEAERRRLELEAVTDFEAVAGQGVSGRVGGRAVAVGSGQLLLAEAGWSAPDELRRRAEARQAEGQTVVWVAVERTVAGWLALADTVKPSARPVVARLRKMGLGVALVTGDNPGTAQAVARQVDTEPSFTWARVSPVDKAERIADWQAAGRQVAMVGDGINDAPALAQADVGLAIGAGTDVALETAGVVLPGDRLDGVVTALALARRTMGLIHQNLVWAFAYNVLALPLAAFGALNPIISAAAMAVSSLSVVGNSLRLRGFRM